MMLFVFVAFKLILMSIQVNKKCKPTCELGSSTGLLSFSNDKDSATISGLISASLISVGSCSNWISDPVKEFVSSDIGCECILGSTTVDTESCVMVEWGPTLKTLEDSLGS